MGRTMQSKKCLMETCNNTKVLNSDGTIKDCYCSAHKHKATVSRFLSRLYMNMSRRVRGVTGHDRGNWKGKSILPRDVFVTWAKNNPDFMALYKRYVMNDFDRRLAPSINRINSNRGYTLDNMEWLTNSQNSGLSGSVHRMNNKQKKVIYNLLGVNK